MKLVVDENIPGAQAAFAQFGELCITPGRAIDRALVRDADVLLVRSVTRVDRALLDGSSVRFVGSTTAGIDHVNRADLHALGVQFAHAPGSNAESVVDYVLSALALCYPVQAQFAQRRVGIIGCGHVGGRVLQRLLALGVECLVHDPFLSSDTLPQLTSLQEVLRCDVLTMHVPLTQSGNHPTWHMIGAAELACLPADALFINTSRGAAVDSVALHQALQRRPQMRAVLDVWEHEPAIDSGLLARVLIGTPHIAGYALDGKLRGVVCVYDALREFLGYGAPAGDIDTLALPAAGELTVAGQPQGSVWQRAVRACYDVCRDDVPLRGAVQQGEPMATAFDRLRRDYPPRRELSAWRVPALLRDCVALRAAGFDSTGYT